MSYGIAILKFIGVGDVFRSWLISYAKYTRIITKTLFFLRKNKPIKTSFTVFKELKNVNA
jgi:hypothetical protein